MPSTVSTGLIIAALAVLSCAFVPADKYRSAHAAPETPNPATSSVDESLDPFESGEARHAT